MTFYPQYLGGYSGGIGLVSSILCITTIITLLPLRYTIGADEFITLRLTSGIVILYYLGWFFLLPHEIRYLYPIFPFIAIIASFTIERIWLSVNHNLLWMLIQYLLVGILFVNSSWFEPARRELFFNRLAAIVDPERRNSFLIEKVRVYPAFEFINKNLQEDAKILLLPYENRGYYLEREYIWGHPIAQRIIPFEKFSNPNDFVMYIKSLGVTHIMENPEWIHSEILYWDTSRELMIEVEEKCCDKIESWGEIVLYKVISCREE